VTWGRFSTCLELWRHAAARVAAQARADEVLVSTTVRDLVAGSGIAFEDRGLASPKGVGEWRLYEAVGV